MSYKRQRYNQRKYKKLHRASKETAVRVKISDNGKEYYIRAWKDRNSIKFLKKVANRKVRYSKETLQGGKFKKIDCAIWNYY